MSQGKLTYRAGKKKCSDVANSPGALHAKERVHMCRVWCCFFFEQQERNLLFRANRQARKRLYARQGLKGQKNRQRRKEDPSVETFQQASSHAELMGTPRRLERPEKDAWFGHKALVSLYGCWMLGRVSFYRSRWSLGKLGV